MSLGRRDTAGFAWAAHSLQRGTDTYRVAARGILIGIIAFSPSSSRRRQHQDPVLAGRLRRRLGGGLFAVGTMLAAMAVSDRSDSGIVVGAWALSQATAIGSACWPAA